MSRISGEKKQSGRSLSKKQFFYGIAAVCGIALLIEGILLFRMLTKKPEPKADATDAVVTVVPAGKRAESYSRDMYKTEDGERRFVENRKVIADEYGRVTYTYVRIPGGSPAIPYETETEEYYEYDKKGRLARLTTVAKTYEGEQPSVTETVENYEYRQKEGTLSRAEAKTTTEGETLSTTETRYDKEGVMIFRQEKNGKGTVVSETSKTYDEYYNLIGYEYYKEGQKKTVLQIDPEERTFGDSELFSKGAYRYDGEWRLIQYSDGMAAIRDSIQPTRYVFEYYSDSRIPDCGKAYYLESILYTVEYDELGRIKYIYSERWNRNVVFNWEAEDPQLPGKKVLCVTESTAEGSVVTEDSYYLLTFSEPEPEDRTNLSCYKVSEFVLDKITSVTMDGTWKAELYSRTVYEDDAIEQTVRSTFDADGNRVETIEDRLRGNREIWEYDDHGNLTRHAYGNIDDENSLVIEEYEYTYY